MKQLQSQLTETIKTFTEVAKEAGNFVLEQSPELVEQAMTWHFVASFSQMLLGLILIFTASCASYKAVKNRKNDDCTALDDEFLCFICACVLLLVFAIGVITIDFAWLQILIAPKLFIVEQAAQLAK